MRERSYSLRLAMWAHRKENRFLLAAIHRVWWPLMRFWRYPVRHWLIEKPRWQIQRLFCPKCPKCRRHPMTIERGFLDHCFMCELRRMIDVKRLSPKDAQ